MWRRYLRFWGDDAPSDIDNEIAFHLEELVKHLKARVCQINRRVLKRPDGLAMSHASVRSV